MAQNRKDNYQNNEFVEKNEPFKNDLLGRKDIAQLWQDTLLKSGKHFVMAVDASWGMGKSYFARNWECKLLHDDYKVCYIDAFKYDFTDDPFMTITSNLIEAFEFKDLNEVANKLNVFIRTFKNQTLENMPLLVEGGMQVLINQAAPVLNTSIVNSILKCLKGITKIFTKSIQESSKTTMNPMDKVVDKDKNYSQVLLEFKNLLKEKTANLVENNRQPIVGEVVDDSDNIFEQEAKPLIVIVDELDRCKPTFAIEFLEKLKHLFDIPNMIFILFINEAELVKSITHTYGVDGGDYLGKFINFKIELKNKNEKLETSKIMSFIERKFNFDNIKVKPVANGFDKDKNINPIHDLIKTLHTSLNLSFRDIINLHMFCEFISDFIKDEYNFAFVIILKALQMTHHNVYSQLLNIDEIRRNNILSTDNQHIELPLFMNYSVDKIQNRYINVFSLLWERIASKQDIHIASDIKNSKSYSPSSMMVKDKYLQRLLEASENMNVGTYHQYIDKLILYINLDIPDIDKI